MNPNTRGHSEYQMWQLALQLFNSEAVAAGSVLLFNLYSLTLLGMIVITPDVPVLFFCSLSAGPAEFFPGALAY